MKGEGHSVMAFKKGDSSSGYWNSNSGFHAWDNQVIYRSPEEKGGNILKGKGHLRCEYISQSGHQCDVWFPTDYDPVTGKPLERYCEAFHRGIVDLNNGKPEFLSRINEHKNNVCYKMSRPELDLHVKSVEADMERYIQEAKIKLIAARQVMGEYDANLSDEQRAALRKQQVSKKSTSPNGQPTKARDTKSSKYEKMASSLGLTYDQMMKGSAMNDMLQKYRAAKAKGENETNPKDESTEE
jgi:hypothetical protein